MKLSYLKSALVLTIIDAQISAAVGLRQEPSSAQLQAGDNRFTQIYSAKSNDLEEKWSVRAEESPDEIRIYIQNPHTLFPSSGKLSYRVTSEGHGIQVVYDKKYNPKKGGYGPIGGFDLPHNVAQELWSNKDDIHFITPVQLSLDEIMLVIPKDKNKKSSHWFWSWWNKRKFTLWSDYFRRPGDLL